MTNLQDDKSFFAIENLGRLMARLALPSVVSQLVTMLYVVIGRAFVGHIPDVGVDALAGMGVVLPMSAFAQAFSLYIAAGAAPLAGMKLGEGDREGVRHIIGNATALLVIVIIAELIAFIPVCAYALPWLGASEATLPYAQAYLYVYIVGIPFMLVCNVVGMLLLAQGDATKVLVVNIGSSILNVGLCGLFIFGFNWGVAGAAWAADVAQLACAIVMVVLLQDKSSPFRLCKGYVKLSLPIVKRILSIGAGRLIIFLTEGLLVVILNGQMQTYGGDMYVAALTVLVTMQMLIFEVTNGLTQGMQGILSYCYGAQLEERTKKAIRAFVLTSTAGCFIVTGSFIVFSAPIAALFTTDAPTANLVVEFTPLFLSGMTLIGLQMGFQSVFMAVGKGMRSFAVTCFRKIVLYFPLAFILPPIYGTWGVILAEPVSDIVSIVFCTVLFACSYRKIMRDMYKDKISGR